MALWAIRQAGCTKFHWLQQHSAVPGSVVVAAIRLLESGADLQRSALSPCSQRVDRCGVRGAAALAGRGLGSAWLGVSASMARLVHGNRRLSGRNTVPVVMGQASDGRGRRQGHRDTRLAAGDRAADPDTGAGEPAGRLARLAVSDRVALLASDRPSSPNSVRRVYGSRRAQRGVYALEFGLVFVVFFLVFFNTYKGGRRVERELVDFCRTLGGSPRQILWRVRIPTAAAWTFAALPNAISFALIGVVLAEFVGSTTGMGYLMITALATLNATDLFAAVTRLSIGGIALVYCVTWLERRLLHWAPEFRE
ncbi:hypothetical protein G6F57_016732 [Rhizopus arrhizus]|nr:hypothetical protein G6F57_016732 [Rhizopus arrhizus]